MNPLRRPEILILIAIVLALLAWVVWGNGGRNNEDLWEEEATTPYSGSAENPSNPVSTHDSSDPQAQVLSIARLHSLTLIRDFGNAKLVIHLTVQNPSDSESFPLLPPQVRLITNNGNEVPPFFLPFNQPPTLKPNGTGETELAYWLDAQHLQGTLNLVIDGKSFPIKSLAQNYDLDDLENDVPVSLKPTDW